MVVSSKESSAAFNEIKDKIETLSSLRLSILRIIIIQTHRQHLLYIRIEDIRYIHEFIRYSRREEIKINFKSKDNSSQPLYQVLHKYSLNHNNHYCKTHQKTFIIVISSKDWSVKSNLNLKTLSSLKLIRLRIFILYKNGRYIDDIIRYSNEEEFIPF